jgi:hypothetical protein
MQDIGMQLMELAAGEVNCAMNEHFLLFCAMYLPIGLMGG